MNSNSSMDDNDQTPSSNDMKSQNGHTSCNSSPKMSAEERFQKLISIGQECTKEDELSKLLTKKPQPICYDGFEPSGRMHIAQGVMKVINVKKMTSAGCKVKIWIADWFAHLNLKMGGDLNNIQTAGKYFIEIWKAFGMVEGGVEFLWASEEINSRLSEYLPLVFDIARKSNLLRIKRCCQIMGRNEEDELMGSQILYPCMQCADIFFLEADICQMGMDQRKVNMLAREYCDDIKRKNKPIILSHHMLPGLQQGQEKMSKSNPLSSIFMEDGEEEVNEKIKKAYCPPPQKTAEGNPCLEETVKGNPCLQYIKYLIFPWFNEFTVDHSIENGGNKTYKNFKELVTDYAEEKLLSADLKPALSNSLNKILQHIEGFKSLNEAEGLKTADIYSTKETRVTEKPVRDRFNSDTNAKDLLERVKELLQRSNSAMEGDVQIPPSNNMNTRPINSRNGHTSSSSSPKMSAEETRERFRIVRGVGEECKYEDELWKLLAENPEPICYDGFEPSGRMHIAEGIMKVINVGKLTSAGCKVKIWIADWFALLNIKKGGDLNKIQTIGRYFIEICKAFGMDEEGVEFLWASEEIKSRSSEYLPLVFDIAKRTSLTRLKRCSTIMGREEDELTGGHIWYICMQCADVFFLKADICQTGMDQREVNELAREYCDDIKKKNKPIFLPHHILPGLQQGQEKMSKSDPSSCIYMDDEEAEVNRKIKKKAYCPPKIVEGNTCLAYVKYLVFPWFDEFEVELSTTNGGNKIYKTFEELVFDYEDEKLLPADLKTALSKALNKILQPVREHFNKDADLKNLLKEVKGIKM